MASKEYFKALKIVHFALLAGMVVFALISVFLNLTGTFSNENEFFKEFFIYIIPLFVLVGIVVSNVMFKKGLKQAKDKNNLLEKMNFYRSALITRYAPLEGSAMFAIIAYLLSGDLIILGLAIIVIFIFLFIRPTAEKAGNDLELDYTEKQILNGPNGMIE